MLKRFTEIDGVSGCEKCIRDEIFGGIKNYADKIETDSMGNLIAYKNAKNSSQNSKSVILSAHMDEVGLIVTGITESGMLKFDTVGGIDTSVLLSKQVRCGELNGVIGLKPFHHCGGDEREACPDIDELYIDIGAKNRSDAMKYVMVGDYFSFNSSYRKYSENIIKAKALDDRIGCAVMVEILKENYNCNLICMFDVQEETGTRGAKAAVYGKKADCAIVLECTTAGDITNAKPHMTVTEIGKGPAISVMDSSSIADKELSQMIKDSAERNGIKYQLKRAATGGNDAGIIHISNGGIRTCSISVPSRYIHSPSSLISAEDFENMKRLLKAFLNEL